jgi:hypothetical protein
MNANRFLKWSKRSFWHALQFIKESQLGKGYGYRS